MNKALAILALSGLVFLASCGGGNKPAAETETSTEMSAAAEEAPAPVEEAAASSAWTVDTENSTVKWEGSKKVGGGHVGAIGLQGGEIEVGGNGIEAGTIVIDMTTITNEDLPVDGDYNQAALVGHLSNEDFFDVAKYPTATLSITGSEGNKVMADLTIKGQTHPIEFDVELNAEGNAANATAKVSFDRTKWDVVYGSGNFFKELTVDKVINDEIVLDVALALNKKEA